MHLMYGRQHENSCGRAVYCPLLLIHSLIHGFIHSNMMIDSLKRISQYYDLIILIFKDLTSIRGKRKSELGNQI